MRSDRLTYKQVLFCDKYVMEFPSSPVDAYMSVYPRIKRRSAQTRVSSLLTKDNIKQYVDKLIATLPPSKSVNVDFVLSGIKSIAIDGKLEVNRLRAYEMLGKYLSMFKETQVQTNIITTSDLEDIKTSITQRRTQPLPNTQTPSSGLINAKEAHSMGDVTQTDDQPSENVS